MSAAREYRVHVLIRHTCSCGLDGCGASGPLGVGACAAVNCQSEWCDEFTIHVFSMTRSAPHA